MFVNVQDLWPEIRTILHGDVNVDLRFSLIGMMNVDPPVGAAKRLERQPNGVKMPVMFGIGQNTI